MGHVLVNSRKHSVDIALSCWSMILAIAGGRPSFNIKWCSTHFWRCTEVLAIFCHSHQGSPPDELLHSQPIDNVMWSKNVFIKRRTAAEHNESYATLMINSPDDPLCHQQISVASGCIHVLILQSLGFPHQSSDPTPLSKCTSSSLLKIWPRHSSKWT